MKATNSSPEHLDALVAAPEHHTLLFENDAVRVLDTRIKAGDMTPVHSHRWPAALYILSWSSFVRRNTRGEIILDSRTLPSLANSPQALWSEALLPHSLENVGTSDLHVISVEVKQSVAGFSKMRKQYYFRPGERGLMAWDVDRLVTLSKDLPRIDVPLAAIRELDAPFSSEEDDPLKWRDVIEHAKLIEAADLSFPIILSSNGSVMDGMHRVAKAVLLRRTTIEAVQFSDDPDPDYVDVHPSELPYDETSP